MATQSEFRIGTLFDNTINVEELTVPLLPPRATFPEPIRTIELPNGQVRAQGWKVCVWTWDFLTQTQYNQLKTYCTGKSSDVFIYTKDEDGDYDLYSAIMVWPDSPTRIENVYRDFNVLFRNVVFYAEVYT